jgi:hypothetical protein
MSEEPSDTCTPENPPGSTPDTNTDGKSNRPKRTYKPNMSKCVICGGRHDRRDSYGKSALCAQCLADLRHETLSRVTPAVMRPKSKRSRPTKSGEEGRNHAIHS